MRRVTAVYLRLGAREDVCFFIVPEESKNISRSVAVYGLLTDKARSVLNLLCDGRILCDTLHLL